MKRMIFTALVACTALSFAPHAAVAAGFDGTWSVLVVTDKGDCDKAYRYEVRIENGKLQPTTSDPVSMSGAVADDGAIKVSVGRGEQQASGSGRLAGKTGAGRWNGRGNTGVCSGSWSAERRS